MALLSVVSTMLSAMQGARGAPAVVVDGRGGRAGEWARGPTITCRALA